jgi:hypothetical protein
MSILKSDGGSIEMLAIRTLLDQLISKSEQQEFKVISLTFLGIVLIGDLLLMNTASKGLILWGSFVAAIIIPAIVLDWGARRKKRHNKVKWNKSSTSLRQGYNIDCFIHINDINNQKLENVVPFFAGSSLANTSVVWRHGIGSFLNIDEIISPISEKECPVVKLNISVASSKSTLFNTKNTAISAKLPLQKLLETTYPTNTGAMMAPVSPVPN